MASKWEVEAGGRKTRAALLGNAVTDFEVAGFAKIQGTLETMT